jgi:CRISPR type III-A-associated RAMP protein Csm4
LFSALTLAAKQLDLLEEWLDATARSASPAFAFSSLFPFQGDVLFVTPPATLWPPPAGLVTSPSPVFLTKVRWQAANFVPLPLVETILSGQKVLADQWAPDPESACLLRRDRPSTTPFRTVLRTGAPVDRITRQSSAAYTFAGVEFEPGAGLWTVVRFADGAASGVWADRLKGMFRLLADTGLGGRRKAGWGQVQAVEFENGAWPAVLFPKLARGLAKKENGAQKENGGNAEGPLPYWLLSLFSPATDDAIDWSGGDYKLVERRTGGKQLRFVAEGSVVTATAAPVGKAIDITGGHSAQAMYRSGMTLAFELPAWPETPEPELAVESFPEVIEPVDEPTPIQEEPVPEVPVPDIHDPEMPVVVAEPEPTAIPEEVREEAVVPEEATSELGSHAREATESDVAGVEEPNDAV